MTAVDSDMNRFADREHLRHFYKDKGIDGIELMMCGVKDIPDKITQEDIQGLHLGFFPSWYNFWIGNKKALDEEFGDRQTWITYYGGENPQDMLKGWEAELELAKHLGVKYVVFHVSESSLEECVTYRWKHSDQEICDKACEIINCLLDGKDYDFYFLAENLWWSGLNLTDPSVTRRLMEGIHYPKKGIMLDTGHLLHTNNSLRTQSEGVQYIHSVLNQHGDLCRYIKGIHLNQTMSGEYVRDFLKNPIQLTGNHRQQLSQVYPHIFKIDSHLPFTAEGAAELICRIAPKFLTYELITSSLQEHEEKLLAQLKAIERNGGLQ